MFDQEFIDATREAQGDEAADKLIQANQREASATRVQKYRTDPEIAKKYPRMVEALRTDTVALPTFPDDAAADAFMQNQEQFLIAMGAPEPGKNPPETPPTKPTPDQQENQPASENQGPTPLDPATLGTQKGIIPWSDAAKEQVSLRPTAPGSSPDQAGAMVAEIADMMDPQEGEFRRGRERDFAMIKGMEIVNSTQGGPTQIAEMREGFEDADTFPITTA